MKKRTSPGQVLINKLTNSIGLPFQKVLPSAIIEKILIEIGLKGRNRLYNPIVIVWAFISQVLDPDHSCKNAVSRIIAHLAEEDLKTPSDNKACLLQSKKKIARKII